MRTELGSSGWRLVRQGVAMAVALVALSVASKRSASNLEELALDAETRSLFAEVDGHPVHCQDARDVERCVEGWRVRGERSVALWLGNSQLHAVNQVGPDDRTAAALAHERLARSGLDLVTLSQPNANLQEHYVLFEAVRPRLPIEVLVLPLVFDDARETGVRHDLATLTSDPAIASSLRRSPIGNRLADECAATVRATRASSADLAALDETVQESVEQALDASLGRRWSLWAARPQLRGELFVGLHRLRNAALGIDAQTARRLIPGRYADNLEALDALLSSATRHDIAVLGYVAPLRNDVAIPYVPVEYERFKRDVATTFERRGHRFASLEGLVPGELWGRKDATGPSGEPELDFMHFQGNGHVLLGERIASEVESLISLGERR